MISRSSTVTAAALRSIASGVRVALMTSSSVSRAGSVSGAAAGSAAGEAAAERVLDGKVNISGDNIPDTDEFKSNADIGPYLLKQTIVFDVGDYIRRLDRAS